MTCIIGLVEKGHVYMGGDSMAASSWDMQTVAHPKVFRTGKFLIGYTESFRMGQLLQFRLKVPPRKGADDYAYMVTVFAESVRTLFKDGGFLWVENAREQGGQFLVGYRGGLYIVHTDFSVLQYLDGYKAIGCGAPYAMGAMSVLKDVQPKKRIRKALKAAAHFSNGVVGPFYVLSLKEGV